METSKNNYQTWGVVADGIFYAARRTPLNFHSDNTMMALGIYYKGKLAYAKNFFSNFFLGGSAGSDNRHFVYYPFAGFEENFNLSEKFLLTVQQKAAYLMGGNKPKNNWQPGINVGFKITL